MKILSVGNYYYPEHVGGVEVVAYNLNKHFRKAGHQVRWVAADVAPDYREVQKDDVPLRAWNVTEEKLGFPYPIPGPRAIFKIANQVKWCDVVHLHDCLYLSSILTFVAAKLLKKPILLTQHAMVIPYEEAYKRWLQYLAYRTIGAWVFNSVEYITYVTSLVHDRMVQYLRKHKNKEVLINGVDVDFYTLITSAERNKLREKFLGGSEKPIVLFVGRMVERKGVHLLRPLIEKNDKWHWILVGRPDDFHPDQWGYPNMTHLSNIPEEELKDLYASVDVLIHPSVGEGVTLIVMEAMACGTSVIISEESLYGIAEEQRKFFFPVNPTSEDIERTLSEMLRDRDHLQKLRPQIRQFVLSKLSWESVAGEYLNRLQTIAGESKG